LRKEETCSTKDGEKQNDQGESFDGALHGLFFIGLSVLIRMISGRDIQKYLLAKDGLGSLILQGSSQETCVYRVSFGGRLSG
jgi:hypothetical protein